MTSRGSSGLRHRHGSASFQAVNTFCSSILPTPPSQIHPSQWHWKLRHVTQNNFEDTTLHANIHCHQSLVWLQASVLRSNINIRLSPRPLQDEGLIFTDSGILQIWFCSTGSSSSWSSSSQMEQVLGLMTQQCWSGLNNGLFWTTRILYKNIVQEIEGKENINICLIYKYAHTYTHTHI